MNTTKDFALSQAQYGFYGRLNAEFPSQVIVDTTELCNLACIHCAHPTFKKSEYYAGRTLDPELNTKLVDEVRRHGQGITRYIRYSSDGEPLLHTGIFDMLAYAVENSGTTVTLTTNGTLLNEARAEKLLATGVHIVDISIDALKPETYAKIRVRGDLRVTRENVLRLIRLAEQSAARTKIVVSFIEQAENRHETRDFERFWKDHGADYVAVRRLHSNAGFLSPIAEQMRDSLLARRPCVYPWERILLTPRGYLSYCPVDWVQGSTIPGADYRLTTIREVWQGAFYTGLRKAHMDNHFDGYGFCEQCPDWQVTRWPHEGPSYATMVEDFKKTE
ncbi:radical SAM protein [Candidatus Parcubacteria bacterium]|nr:MAG: radical SAM protein [Candidatus Parcubacteria bacterium]